MTLDGTPVNGLLAVEVTVRAVLPGTDLVSVVALTRFVGLGLGLYSAGWPVAVTEALGEVYYEITGAGIDPLRARFDVVPVPPYVSALGDVCVISGNVRDIDGFPDNASQVTIIVRKVPGLQYSGSSFLTNRLVTTTPDYAGNFMLELVYGATVIIEVTGCSVKQQIAVPHQETALLKDLLVTPGT
jgi:hypothetical protein